MEVGARSMDFFFLRKRGHNLNIDLGVSAYENISGRKEKREQITK